MQEKIKDNIDFPITIKEQFDYAIDITASGLYSISISARVKSGKQINSADDEDLQIEIDGRKFREIPPLDKPQYKNIPPAFNGSKLKGLKKTAVFFIWLEKGSHIISLIPDHSARVENAVIEKKEDIKNITFAINEQAEDGDRRPWFAFIFVDFSLKEITVSIIAQSRWFDRDDAQIKIDGEIQSYKNASPLYRFWYWAGSLFKGREEMAYFKPNLKEGVHYVEINADRMPTLNEVKIVLAENENGQEEKNIQSYDLFKGVNGNENYNRFDNEIIEAVDYWNDFFAGQEYPPTELLDYNLVKAIIYRESRAGYLTVKKGKYPAYPDIMQVGDIDNPALATLREEAGYKANEFISKYERGHLSYSFLKEWLPVKVETPKESIFWGVRWMYHKAQRQYGTSLGDKPPYAREWKTWKQAVIDYNGSEKKYEYQRLIWQIYEDGIDPDGNVLWKRVKNGFSLILSTIIIGIVLSMALVCCYTVNKLYKNQSRVFKGNQSRTIEDKSCYDYNHESHIDYSNETRTAVEQVFLKNLEEYKQDQYYYGDIFDETVKECKRRRCWMEIVLHGYHNDLVENMKDNEQFLDAVSVFDFIDPKVGDIDNDGENEIVFILQDILNHDFIKIFVIDKIDNKFQLIEKEMDAYDGHIELKDITGDLIPEIVSFITFGRYGYPLFVYQYKNKELAEIFKDQYIEFPEYTFSDLDGNGKMEIRVIGEEHESLHDYRAIIKRVYEYNPSGNNFILINSETTEI